MARQRGDKFTELEESYARYEVYNLRGEKIGKVDDLFVDEDDRPEYIGVKMGFWVPSPPCSRSKLLG